MKAAPLRPAETLAALDAALASDSLAPVVLVTTSPSARADEPHFFELALRAIVRDARTRGTEVLPLDAADPGFDPAGLYRALTTRSLFAATSVRILKNADVLLKGARGAAAADDEEGDGDAQGATPQKRSREAATHPLEKAALAFLAGAPSGERFVLVSRKLRAPFVRAVREGSGAVFEFRPLYDRPYQGSAPVESTELGEFARALARAAGVRLGAGALGELLARTGNHLGAIDAALEKLRSIFAEREVGVAEIRSHISASRPGNPWTLAESIVAGDAPRALREWALLSRSGARDADGKVIPAEGAFVMALSAAVRDGRRHHAAARLLSRGAALPAAAAAVGVPNFPAALDAFTRAVRARSLAGHRKLLADLLDTELAIRVRREPIASALERLVARARVEPAAAGRGALAR